MTLSHTRSILFLNLISEEKISVVVFYFCWILFIYFYCYSCGWKTNESRFIIIIVGVDVLFIIFSLSIQLKLAHICKKFIYLFYRRDNFYIFVILLKLISSTHKWHLYIILNFICLLLLRSATVQLPYFTLFHTFLLCRTFPD